MNLQKMAKNVFLLFFVGSVLLGFIGYYYNSKYAPTNFKEKHTNATHTEITGFVKSGESLFSIFKKYNLRIKDCLMVREASANIHKLRELKLEQPYKIVIDDNKQIESFAYWINDDSILRVNRTETGFLAKKVDVNYEKKILHIGGVIKDNLISSIGESKDSVLLALELSDIFAWDIDFTTDLRDNDTFKIIVEGLYLDGEFKKYGDIFSAEFINNGESHHAYKFERDGKTEYFDDKGRSLRKAFLKAPLSFRRISSAFSNRRFHPILKIYRPHHGLDYAAPVGTPVSAVGDGKIIFSGYKRGYGKLIIIRHHNGWKTYYGHLSKIEKNIRKGRKVEQNQVIGYVGATGMAKGPHLHYEIRISNKPVNPLVVKLPRGESIPKTLMAEFGQFRERMDARFALITPGVFAFAPKIKDNNI
ncbi:MAG: peptidoglycan DD-metalloendopeptidase family protein [Thermodesulfovibrionales bacterium]